MAYSGEDKPVRSVSDDARDTFGDLGKPKKKRGLFHFFHEMLKRPRRGPR